MTKCKIGLEYNKQCSADALSGGHQLCHRHLMRYGRPDEVWDQALPEQREMIAEYYLEKEMAALRRRYLHAHRDWSLRLNNPRFMAQLEAIPFWDEAASIRQMEGA